ncbi:Coenzyme F420 hydrogenase/dehydrogenase, beta subunit C-terminal domain [Methanobrevibacter filiformis]|uniref:formate dehydrogenase (coenzyme F420) n=1 Tax=Methanobrevibacter filiformis TaxID=55758 RepID=A0A166F8M3_9EURY|nr:Coenzyme F420 hydrogenase/dehydrogenase, beta subunit C-terminal domain [Methanobrevibacter filiformis]KZX17422.1 coenzyme F420-reducing hydrogenase subunit beta [Methanobrevibacter filiformis]
MVVKVNDVCYMWSADDNIAAKGEYGGAVTTLMKYFLDNNVVDAVLAVEKAADLYDAVPTLITDSGDIEKSAGSLHCGTLNLAKVVERYLDGLKDIKIAVTCKPCDAMTLRELIKKGRVQEDNLIMVGVNCGGTMPPNKTRIMIDEVFNLDPDDVVKEEIAKGKLIIETTNGEKEISIDELEEEGWGRRTNCQRCEVNIPSMADIALGNWGVIGPLAGKATFVEVFSEKGAEILDKIVSAGVVNVEEANPKGVEIRAKIDQSMVKLANKAKDRDYGDLEGDILSIFNEFSEEFSRCMKCFGCREACPICYCSDCILESGPDWITKGLIPAAPLFHLGRAVHMADSCTNCGQCEEVCPSEISVAHFWGVINDKIKTIYGYTSGIEDNSILSPLSNYQDKGLRG